MLNSNKNNIWTVKEGNLGITQSCQNMNILIYLAIHSGHLNSIWNQLSWQKDRKEPIMPLSSFDYSHAYQNSLEIKFGFFFFQFCLSSSETLQTVLLPKQVNRWKWDRALLLKNPTEHIDNIFRTFTKSQTWTLYPGFPHPKSFSAVWTVHIGFVLTKP